jgi:hypothetical protein
VLSRHAPSEGLATVVTNREASTYIRYLAAPRSSAAGYQSGDDDLVSGFLALFGGFRFGPPFRSDFFFRQPGPPLHLVSVDERIQDPRWKGALSIYMTEELDELILHPSERCGWLLRYSRDIIEIGTFADVVNALPYTIPSYPTSIYR